MKFQPGDQVTVYSGPNVVDSATGQPFWFPAVITHGPVIGNKGTETYCTLGMGPAAYPFDQTYHLADDLRPASEPNPDLDRRYQAFRAWAYPNG